MKEYFITSVDVQDNQLDYELEAIAFEKYVASEWKYYNDNY